LPASAQFFEFAARRGGAPIQFPISKKLKIEVAKNGIVFAYRDVPFNSKN
jgi:hypothetical protein